tara:strand:+ start:347 stop:514 length:168 start_codon:yes stop_codon:yes gene_type:complete
LVVRTTTTTTTTTTTYLHGLARDVEWQVLAVYNALKEAHPLGEQRLALGLDEDLA